MAEALQLGLDVIATAYGGNTDFCTSPLAHPFADGHRWGEPDLDHAAELMQQGAAAGAGGAVEVEGGVAGLRGAVPAWGGLVAEEGARCGRSGGARGNTTAPRRVLECYLLVGLVAR